MSTHDFHPVADRLLFVRNIPLDTPTSALQECFDICLGKNSLSFLQYPYDTQAKCHKGFAFALLTRQSDVRICLSRQYRSWFYVAGNNNEGRAYLRIRSAQLEACNERKEVPTHLVFSPVEDGIGLREFKLTVENVVASLGITIVKSEGVLDGRQKFVNLHTADAESSAVAKMFMHQFKENGMTMHVRYARQPKAVAKRPEPEISLVAPVVERKLVLEPITENYGKFGIPYSEAIKKASAAPAAPVAAPSQASAPTSSMPTLKDASAGNSTLPANVNVSRRTRGGRRRQQAAKNTALAGSA